MLAKLELANLYIFYSPKTAANTKTEHVRITTIHGFR